LSEFDRAGKGSMRDFLFAASTARFLLKFKAICLESRREAAQGNGVCGRADAAARRRKVMWVIVHFTA
jgi:hypothetical protein